MKKVRGGIQRVIGFLSKVYLLLSCIMLAVCVSSTVLGVVFRFILQSPLKWVEEAAALSQAWMVCLLIPQMDIKYEHITMEIFFNAMKRPVQLAIRIFQSVLTCALAVMLLKYAISVVELNAKLHTITATLLIPYHYIYMALPIAFGFMIVVHVGKILTGDFGLKTPPDTPMGTDEGEVTA